MRTNVFRTTAVIVGLALALVLAACSKGPDLTRAKAKAFELLGQYGPKVSGQIGKHADLKARLAKVPPELPGVAETGKLLEADHATIARLKGLLDGYAAAIDKAGKEGKQAGIEAAMNAFADEMNQGLGAVTASLEASDRTIAALEEVAKAQAAPPPVAEVAIALPGGGEVMGASGGVEQQLVARLGDRAALPAADDEAAWLTLDRVRFAPDQAEPGGAGGKAQLAALLTIAAAFPKAKLTIGGHASAGEARAVALATARAQAVMKALIAGGADEKRLAFEGRGVAHPACATNDTDDCTGQNRRVAVRVTAR
jgi:outer membrane protein OmpA-like peptidoglycan-associated protein